MTGSTRAWSVTEFQLTAWLMMPVASSLTPASSLSPGPVRLLRPPLLLVLFEADYPAVENAKIYVGKSRHWAAVWVWFFS
ncbi:hypothetical protein ACIOKD_37970 [Streptomyces sp. NPDC087844]|uniref:hypothetical protein n=1 Tax=Streptomyces sp. NPDC087844 TaxID=3365805 RepID=UPI00381A52C6